MLYSIKVSILGCHYLRPAFSNLTFFPCCSLILSYHVGHLSLCYRTFHGLKFLFITHKFSFWSHYQMLRVRLGCGNREWHLIFCPRSLWKAPWSTATSVFSAFIYYDIFIPGEGYELLQLSLITESWSTFAHVLALPSVFTSINSIFTLLRAFSPRKSCEISTLYGRTCAQEATNLKYKIKISNI